MTSDGTGDRVPPPEGFSFPMISDLGSTTLEIVKPFRVDIVPNGVEFLGTVKATEGTMFAWQESTPELVVEGIKDDVCFLYDLLTNMPESQIGPWPLKQKAFLLEHVRRKTG